MENNIITEKKERQSNIELLRCLLMLMIVVVHFLGHNILYHNDPVQLGESNFLSSNLLFSLCVCAVDCFVLISGYFSIRFSVKKVFLFLIPICFYQLALSLIFYKFHHQISFNPFRYWFVGPYTFLMIITPIFNGGLTKLSKERLQLLLLLSILLFFLPVKSILGEAGKNCATFVFLYIVGFYLRNNDFLKFKSWGGYLGLYLLSTLLIFVETFFLCKMGHNTGTVTLSYNYDNILIILAAVFLFQTFRHIQLQSKFVNWVATSSFFVYIISENEYVYGHPGLYDLLRVSEWSNHPLFIILILISSISIFVISIGIDKLRKILVGPAETKIGEYISKLIDDKINIID